LQQARVMTTVTCADCGAAQIVPDLPPGSIAECNRCDRFLARHTVTGYEVTFACAAGILILIWPAVFLPLMESTIRNLVFQESRLVSSVPVIYTQVWFPFAFGFLFFALLFPALRAILQILVFGSIEWGWRIPHRGRLFRYSEELRIWCLSDVVVIAGLVAYYRADVSADVAIGSGAWSYIAVAILTVLGDRTLDRRTVWNAILPDRVSMPKDGFVSCDVCEMPVTDRAAGDACPRCGGTLDRPIVRRFAPALAAVLAAIPLCVPAYAAAVMVNDNLTGIIEHTVLGTVQMLADRGYWQLGVIVLIAGVAIPCAEIVGMLWLLARVPFPSSRGLVRRTRMYRVLRGLVRWPMILPFIAAIVAPIVNYRGIDDIVAGPGATPLFIVIALMMLAVRLFEPKFMWRTAGEVR
jgi:paraquat-inducible protein A